MSGGAERRRGIVEEFDVERGLGTIVAEDGSRHRFHCIEIVNGTRSIEPGTAVGFELLAKLGRYEAARIAT
ncbi:MAG: cold shock domain-containing protein [Acidimicrobiia bacterium]|nr:cold shock domain-containing protein [Acidimicrobiia bacterium]